MGDGIDETIRHPSGRRRRVAGVMLAAAVVLAGGGYLAGHLMTSQLLPARTEIQGVPVGGLDRDRARAKVQQALTPALERPVRIGAGETTAQLDPADSGLAVDWAATMAQVDPTRSWNPRVIWNSLRGGARVPLIGSVDRDSLHAAVAAHSARFAVTAEDAGVTLSGTRVVRTAAVQGRSLDVAATAGAVAQAWPTPGPAPVPAAVTHRDPAITDAEVAEAVDGTLRPTLSGPVTLLTARGELVVPVDQIAAATTVGTAAGRVGVSTDLERLYRAGRAARDELGLSPGKDARILISGGRPTIQPSTEGQGVTLEEFARVVRPALTRSGRERRVTARISAVPAEFSTDDARRAGVNRVTGEFTTRFPYAAYRNTNLTIAANTINNTYLAPGQTFSMDEVLGPRTAAKGCVDGWVISGDQLRQESAGGISQSATTTFNAAFFAGMTDLEHHPHTLYFSRYPAGREATLYYGQLDLRFRNDTRYGVLIQAFTTKAPEGGSGSITVRMWSTPSWQRITASDPVRSNWTDGRTVVSEDPQCHPQSPSPGFDVRYSRLFWRDGAVVRRENFFWRYDPTDEVICR